MEDFQDPASTLPTTILTAKSLHKPHNITAHKNRFPTPSLCHRDSWINLQHETTAPQLRETQPTRTWKTQDEYSNTDAYPALAGNIGEW